jgi:hypothetical protein
MTVDPAIRASQFDYSTVWPARHTHRKIWVGGKIVLTVTKRNPGQFTLPGFYRLLPQLVGSCDPGGEVRGWGRPDWPTRSTVTAKSIRRIAAKGRTEGSRTSGQVEAGQ